MYQSPQEPRKIRSRIRRYEREMRKEYEEHGYISDGYGKRYLLGHLYLLMGDLEGALNSFQWYEQMFPDDVGEPFHYLSWVLALYRSGDLEGAQFRLRQAMLSNLYLIPHLLGLEQEILDMWHGSNMAERDYLEYAPPEIWELWDEEAIQWVKEVYDSAEFRRIRGRCIEINKQLQTEPRGPKRSQLVNELFELSEKRDV